MKAQKLSIIIPTRNGGTLFIKVLKQLRQQTRQADEILVIDSSSEDNTVKEARRYNARVEIIPAAEFDHGGTRSMAARLACGDLLLYMTQDALPANSRTVENLLAPFAANPSVRVSYGRQLPHEDANPFARYLRGFNYPPISETRSFEDRAELGFRTAFASNSLAAYEKNTLAAVGWFPENQLFGEDTCTVAAILKQGFRIAYAADAEVIHSHNHSLVQDFCRYFDVGAFHDRQRILINNFGSPRGEGMRYVRGEAAYLLKNHSPILLPAALLRNAAKFIAYRLGRQASRLPLSLVTRLSMHSNWWRRQANS